MASFNHGWDIPLLQNDVNQEVGFVHNEQLPLVARGNPPPSVDICNNSKTTDDNESVIQPRAVIPNPFATFRAKSPDRKSQPSTYHRSSTNRGHPYYHIPKHNGERSKSPGDYNHGTRCGYSRTSSNGRSRDHNHESRKGDNIGDDFDYEHNSLKWSPRTYSGRNQHKRKCPLYGREPDSKVAGQYGSGGLKERGDTLSYRQRNISSFGDLNDLSSNQHKVNSDEPFRSTAHNFQDKNDHSKTYDTFQQSAERLGNSPQSSNVIDIMAVASKINIDESAMNNIKLSLMMSGTANLIPGVSHSPPQQSMSLQSAHSKTNHYANPWADGKSPSPSPSDSNLTMTSISSPPYSYSERGSQVHLPSIGLSSRQPCRGQSPNWSHPIPVLAPSMQNMPRKTGKHTSKSENRILAEFTRLQRAHNTPLHNDPRVMKGKLFPPQDKFWVTANQSANKIHEDHRGPFGKFQGMLEIPGLDMPRNSLAASPPIFKSHRPSNLAMKTTSYEIRGSDRNPMLSNEMTPSRVQRRHESGGDACGNFKEKFDMRPPSYVASTRDVPRFRSSTPINKVVPRGNQGSGHNPVPSMKTPSVEQRRDSANNLIICDICTSYVVCIVLHYVNLHPEKEVPCKLNNKALQTAIQDLTENCDDSDSSNANDEIPVDDLSWLPVGEVFEDAVCCKYCNVESNMRYYMVEHVKTHIGKKNIQKPAQPRVRRVRSSDLFCRFCEFQTSDMSDFCDHVSGHTGEFAYGCGYCSFRSPTMGQAKSHVLNHHANKKASINVTIEKKVPEKFLEGHACSLCGFVQLNANTTALHVKSKHAQEPSARVVAINMSRTVYKIVPTEQNVPTDAEKSCAEKDSPMADKSSERLAEEATAADVSSLVVEKPTEPPRKEPAHEKDIPEENPEKQNNASVSEGDSSTKKSDHNNYEESTKVLTESETTEKEQGELGGSAATIWKANPAYLNNTVAKLRAQLVKDGASIAAAEAEMPIEQSHVENKSCHEKLQSWATREKTYICGMPCCVSVFTSEDALASHRDFIHKDLTIALCRECDLTLPSIGEFLKHLRGPAHAEFKKKFVCSAESVCQFTSVSGKIFMEHINKKHLDKKWLTCYWCNKKVLTSQALAEHIESKCNTQKKLIAAFVKYGLAGLPDDLSDIEEEEHNKEKDGHLQYDETRSSDSPSSTDAEQDIESDRCDNPEVNKSCVSSILETENLSLSKRLESEGEISRKRVISSEETGPGLSEELSLKRAKIDATNKQDEAAVAVPCTQPVLSLVGNTTENSSNMKTESLEKTSTMANNVDEQDIINTNLSHKETNCNSPVPAVVAIKPALNPKVVPKPITGPTLVITHQSNRPFSSVVLPSFLQGKPISHMKVVAQEPKIASSVVPVSLEKDAKNPLPSLQILSVVSLASSSSSQSTLKHEDLKDDPTLTVTNLKSNDANINDPPIMDMADVYEALAASCIFITSSSLPADSLKLNKYHASVRKDAATPSVERATIRKTKKPHSAMLSENSLQHLYKCAGNHCAYTTSDESHFLKHVSDAKKDKDRVCVYCLEVFHRPETLVRHVRVTHGTSAYQCAHCFYRAHTQTMILLHTHLHHSELQAKSFLVPTTGKAPKRDPPTAKDVFKFVKPFVCGQDLCSYASVEEEDFKRHLKNDHVTLNKFKCFYCTKSLEADVLLIHLKEHGIRNYHCLLCEWGTDDDTASMVHMCENHSEQPSRLYKRGGCISKIFQTAVSVKKEKQCDPPKDPTKDSSILAGEDANKGAWDIANARSGIKQEKYRCGYSNCQFTAHDVTRLESHMKMCYLINKGHSLQCPTCKILFHDQAAYSAHVPSHDVRRYSCGLCAFRAQLPHYVKHHIRAYHRIPFEEMKCVPLNQSDDLDSAEFVFVQKPPNSPQKVTEATSNSSASSSQENSAIIESLDNVPQQSIFPKEKMCAWCGYSTKVRVNLVRHLEKHKSQPLTLPVPIPARVHSPEPSPSCSSIAMERQASPAVQNMVEEAEPKYSDKIQRNWNEVQDQEYPQYVPPNELFRCSISGCHYLAVDRSLYEFHINTLHGNSRVLPCPHCPEQPHTVAVLIRHLRLHGPSLYRCSECEFLGMSRHSIKIHAVGTHGVVSSYTVIRDGDCDPTVGRQMHSKLLPELESSNKSSRHGCGGNAKAVDVEWECGICDLRAASRMEVKKHLSEKHLLSVLYRCSACGHGEKTHAQVLQHIASTHPRSEVKIQDLVRWRVRGERNSSEKGRKSPGKRQETSSSTCSEKRFSCYLCSYKCNYKTDMRLHIFREMGYSKYSCGFCEMRFVSRKFANKHSCRKSEKPNINVDADEELEREVNARLKSQELKVSSQCDEPTGGNDPLPADYVSCELLETTSQDHAKDPENSSEVFLFKCPACLYKTNVKSALRKHLLRHLHYRPYKCGHCGVRFPKPKQCLSHHDSQHDGLPVDIENDVDQRCLKFVSWVLKTMDTTLKNDDLPESPLLVGSAWQCSFDDCNVKTTSLKSLLDHFVCHVPRSAFRCGLCPFSGNSKSTVEVHCRRLHSGNMSVLQVKLGAGSEGGEQEVPCGISISATSSMYECPFCPYVDLFPSNVNRHALRHYDFRFYSCGHCGTECLEPCDVEDHCASEHPNMQVLVKTKKKPDLLNVCKDEPCDSNESGDHRFQCFKCTFETMDLKCIRAHCREMHEPLSIFLRIAPPEQDAEIDVDGPNEELSMADPNEQDMRGISDGKRVTKTKYYCNYCDHAADCHENLELHWQSQHHQLPFIVSVPQPMYQCPQCDFTSMDVEVVKRHVTNHLKRYMCQRCGKEVHTFVEGVQHSKAVHPNVAMELIPHPNGTEKTIQELIDGVRIVPNFSKCSDSPGVFIAPRSGRKMARKQCRSSKFTPKIKRRTTARKGPVRVEKRTFAVPRPTEEEMNRITCTVTKRMGFKFRGVFSLRQLSEKLALFPTTRALVNMLNV